jgi:hypothetical protein
MCSIIYVVVSAVGNVFIGWQAVLSSTLGALKMLFYELVELNQKEKKNSFVNYLAYLSLT